MWSEGRRWGSGSLGASGIGIGEVVAVVGEGVEGISGRVEEIGVDLQLSSFVCKRLFHSMKLFECAFEQEPDSFPGEKLLPSSR